MRDRAQEKTVRSERMTRDRQLFLDYTMRSDMPHNPLRYEFRWVDIDGNVAGGPFVTAHEAYHWQEGYEFCLSRFDV